MCETMKKKFIFNSGLFFLSSFRRLNPLFQRGVMHVTGSVKSPLSEGWRKAPGCLSPGFHFMGSPIRPPLASRGGWGSLSATEKNDLFDGAPCAPYETVVSSLSKSGSGFMLI